VSEENPNVEREVETAITSGPLAPRWLIVTIAVIFVPPLLLPSCAHSPINQVQAWRDLRAGFPGFKVVQFAPYQTSDISFDAGGTSGIRFILESEATPNFKVHGTYYISAGGIDREEQSATIRNGMFNGKSLSAPELASLQKKWMSMDGTPVKADMDSVTGPAEHVLRYRGATPPYSEVPLEEVYCLHSGGLYCFRLDAGSGEWQYLPGFAAR